MASVELTTRANGVTSVPEADLGLLAGELSGSVVRPGEPGYDEARTIWNAMIDRRPALIVRCRTAGDVRSAVRLARRHQLLVAVRGGGHNIAGNAVCDGGLMIDLSLMRAVEVLPDARIARVQPGATLGDVDRVTQAFGLAVPTGINSTTGIAGLTLGGGFGWLSRKFGLTADNLISAEMVTAAGAVVRASEDENSDLLWALRGGGGNFGVVTEFVFRLHEVGPQLLSGLVVYSLDEGRQVLLNYRDFATSLGDETAVWAVLRQAPPLPFLPPEAHGKGVVVLAMCHSGDPAEGERVLAPVRKLGTPLGEHIGVQPFADWQQAFDPLLTPGARNYWKSHNFREISDGLIELLVGAAATVPSPHCEIFAGQLGGQVNRMAPDATAYPHREAEFVVNVHGRWESDAEDDTGIAWARGFYRDAAAYATGGVYVNFMPEDETDRVGAAYGGNWDRLVVAKQRWDPDNLFCMNQNIQP